MSEVVIKLGGSLFSQPEKFQPVVNWIGGGGWSRVSIVAGGGTFVDAIRGLKLSDERGHVLSCEMMGMTAKLAGELLGLPVMRPSAACESPVVRDLSGWVLEQDDIPRDWSLTSDSIAAMWARDRAQKTGAAELILVKSARPPSLSIASLADCGFVDRYFPVAAGGLSEIRVACVEGESRVREYSLNWDS